MSKSCEPNFVVFLRKCSIYEKYDISNGSRVSRRFKMKLEMCFYMYVNLFIVYLEFFAPKIMKFMW